jgi:hypothetical protein
MNVKTFQNFISCTPYDIKSIGIFPNVTKLAKEGKAHNFQVELRPPDELSEAFSKEGEEGDC